MLVYHTLLAMIDHLRERTDRQLFSSQNQIRMQNIAMREAQAMEQKAQATKKSFVSYIFHEVRVPLNTALLALQNLDGEDVFKDLDKDQAIMVNGLMGSLTMMEKVSWSAIVSADTQVLNDVLSHSRMEQGTLVQAKEPFDFHKSMHIVGLSYRSQSELSGVRFELELDPMIDVVAPAFIGDEMRLRQITSNLVSNALKFTEAGGTVRLVTKLIFPPVGKGSANDSELSWDAGSGDLGKADGLRHLRRSFDAGVPTRQQALPRSVSSPSTSTTNSDKVVVRVEVHDTGVGIREAELVDNNLFSPYVQTEIGRRQGGKGSGLGLALVMQIVKLSKGRLGVDSEVGKGSCFWFEMPYTIPSAGDELPQESRHILLTKPSFLHVMGSPQVATAGLPPRRDSVTSAEEYLDSGSEAGSGFVRPALVRHTSMEEGSELQLSPRLARPQSAVDPPFHNFQRSQLQTIPSSPSASPAPFDSLAVAGEARDTVARAPSRAEIGPSCPPVSIETRRSLSISSLPPKKADTPPPQRLEIPPVHSGSPPILTPASPPIAAPQLNRHHSDGTDIQTPPEPTPGIGQGELFPGVTSPLPSVNEQAVSPKPESEPPETAPTAAILKPRPEPPVRRKSSGRSLSALVVDDDSLTRRLMSRMLSRLGHVVTTVDNGKKAVDLILENAEDSPFEIVFLDNQMPIMTGVEAVAALRQAGNDTYVVGCTGNALREDQDEYIASGANAIIAKPVHQAAILEHLAEARRRSDVRRAMNDK